MSRPVIVALVLVLALAPVVGGVAAASTPESASLGERTVTVTRGETAEITVSHSAAANLTIGSQDKGFEVVVPLGGDGTDTVEIDTYATTGAASSYISVGGASLETPELDHSLAAGTYTVTVTIDGNTEAFGQLKVLPRDGAESFVGVAPTSLEPTDSETGVLSQTTERGTVAQGDYAVFVVNDSSLSSAFNPDDLSGGAAASGIEARLVQLDPAPNTPTDEYVPTSTSAATVISKYGDDGAGDRFAVVWDTSQLETPSRSNGTYEFQVTLRAEHNALVEEDQRIVTERVTVEAPSIELQADPSFTLSPWDGATMQVSGETNLAPKSTVDLRAVQEEPEPFLWSHDLTVSENGTFSAGFDFSSASPPTSFPLWVQGYQNAESQTVTLTAANASVAFDAQTTTNEAVTVRSVNLSHGGFVRLSTGNATVGSSAYLPAGSHSDVRVQLNQSINESVLLNATVVADRNRNATLDGADAAYNVSGTPVSDSAVVRPETSSSNGSTPNNTTATTPTTTSPAESTTLAVTEEEPLTPVPENETGGSSSGSLPLSPLVVVVAFALVGLLGRRT
jgi:hypothetical protein